MAQTEVPETDVPETEVPETDDPETDDPDTDVAETDDPRDGRCALRLSDVALVVCMARELMI